MGFAGWAEAFRASVKKTMARRGFVSTEHIGDKIALSVDDRSSALNVPFATAYLTCQDFLGKR